MRISSFALMLGFATPAAALARDGGPPIDCFEPGRGCEAPDDFDAPDAGDDVISYQSPGDYDDDGIPDGADNCPSYANANQADGDADGVGDPCDNCPSVATSAKDQQDGDSDGIGDVCDNDRDGDGVLEDRWDAGAADDAGAGTGFDNCPTAHNPDQSDIDNDGRGDACDPDIDGDGRDNLADDCPFGEDNAEGCAGDLDDDGVPSFALAAGGNTTLDNCPTIANPDQANADKDGLGDACDPDADGDGVGDVRDNCPGAANPGQEDYDRDGLGEVCDPKFCFVVQTLLDAMGDEAEDKCLDPLAPFAVDTPNILDARTGDAILLRLFANRENAALSYTWFLIGAPDSGAGGIANPVGETGYSSPFEYHYFPGAEPTLIPRRVGRYTVKVVARQLLQDAVSGETGLTADATAVIDVTGSTLSSTDTCDCGTIGSRSRTGATGILLLFSLMVLGHALARRSA